MRASYRHGHRRWVIDSTEVAGTKKVYYTNQKLAVGVVTCIIDVVFYHVYPAYDAPTNYTV